MQNMGILAQETLAEGGPAKLMEKKWSAVPLERTPFAGFTIIYI